MRNPKKSYIQKQLKTKLKVMTVYYIDMTFETKIKPHTINITKPNELDIGIDYNSLIELYSNSK